MVFLCINSGILVPFLLLFAGHFCLLVFATSVRVHVFSFLLLIIYNWAICHCFHVVKVDAKNVVGLLHSFEYIVNFRLSVLMEERNNTDHEKLWLTQTCLSTGYQCNFSRYNNWDFLVRVLGFDTL
jgi:hypothetical protein